MGGLDAMLLAVDAMENGALEAVEHVGLANYTERILDARSSVTNAATRLRNRLIEEYDPMAVRKNATKAGSPTKQSVREKLEAAEDGSAVTVYLVVSVQATDLDRLKNEIENIGHIEEAAMELEDPVVDLGW